MKRDTKIPFGWVQIFWLSACITLIIFSRRILGEIIFKEETNTLLLTVLFGVTGAVISLMGLVSIFVSLNSQHKIEKCRELYWDMLELNIQGLDRKTQSSKLKRLLLLYGSVFYSADNFIKVVAKISRYGILFVIVSWSFFLGIFDIEFKAEILKGVITVGGIIVLLSFHNVLGKLVQLKKIGDIEDLEQLFDASTIEAERIDIFSLLEHDSSMRVISNTNQQVFLPNFNTPIGGFHTILKSIQIDNFTLGFDKIDLRYDKENYTWENKRNGQELILFWLKHRKLPVNHLSHSYKNTFIIFDFGPFLNVDINKIGEMFEDTYIKLTLPKDTKKIRLYFDVMRGDRYENVLTEYDKGDTGIKVLELPKEYKRSFSTSFKVSGSFVSIIPNEEWNQIQSKSWKYNTLFNPETHGELHDKHLPDGNFFRSDSFPFE